jgi:hypothetical protein
VALVVQGFVGCIVKLTQYRGWRSRLYALYRRIRRLRPIATAYQYWQPRIFHESRVLKRKFAHKENRTAIGLDPACMLAASAEAEVAMVQRVD